GYLCLFVGLFTFLRLFFFSRSCHSSHYHSSPTRRSSDLLVRQTDAFQQFHGALVGLVLGHAVQAGGRQRDVALDRQMREQVKVLDRKSTRLNSSHVSISYAVFCLKKKNTCAS